MSGFVVRNGNPTPEELGVAIAVLTAAVASRVDPTASLHAPLRNWARPAAFHRPAIAQRGRGAWVRSGR